MIAVQLLLLCCAVTWCSSSGANTKSYGGEIERLQETVKELQDLNNQFTAFKERLQNYVQFFTNELKGKHL